MAFLGNHLPLHLFLVTTSLSTFINGNTMEPLNSICPSFSCGGGLVLGYPFWQQDRKPNHCGYPNFGISCSDHDHSPMLQLFDHIYRVRNLNFSENTLTIAYGDVNDTICPVASHGVTLNTTSTFLNFTEEDEMLHFFYNCTLYPPSDVEKIKCLQLGAKHSYVFHEGSIPEFDWKGNCDSVVIVPVTEKGSDGVLASSVGRALQEGFQLKWEPDNVCKSCESSGGFCGYGDGTNKKFSNCFCSDGSHFANCHDRVDGVSTRVEPNILLIGALIFGSLMIISIILYVIRKKRPGGQKKGFSQIPSNGK